MHDIQNVCVFIYLVMVIYITTGGGGWTVKALGCDKKGKFQTPPWTCCDHNIILMTCHGFTKL